MISFKYQTKKNISIGEFLLQKGYSDSNIYYLIKNQNICVNNTIITDKNHILNKKSNKIVVILNEEENQIPLKKGKLNIVYEDEYLLIVNKPSNMDIEPTKRNYKNTLANIISYYFYKNNIKSKIHYINRLDKLTSGLVIVAKNQYIHNLFSNVEIIKKYKALVCGKTNKTGTIKINIGKDENTIKRIVTDDGKECITKYKSVDFDGKNSLVDIKILTGRTHQIRVSFAYINHPLYNDPLYGNKENNDGMYLSAYYLKFTHPITKERIETLN